jgi:hypothetical protein
MENLVPWKVDVNLFKTSPLLRDPTDDVCKHYMERILEWSFYRYQSDQSKALNNIICSELNLNPEN